MSVIALVLYMNLAAAGLEQSPQGLPEASPANVSPPTFPPTLSLPSTSPIFGPVTTPASPEFPSSANAVAQPLLTPAPFGPVQTAPPAPNTDPNATDIPSAPRSGSGADRSRPPAVAGWNNGFFLQSEDKNFVLRITGQIQTDYKTFIDQPDPADINTFLLRRARFGIEANMFQYYEFRFLPDFAPPTPVIQDSYLNVHYVDWIQFEAGRFKQPFSYEQMIQDRFVPTMERSLFDQLVPQRDWGAMIHGQKLFFDRFDYYVSLHDGIINGNAIDNNDSKDVTGRVVLRPLNSDFFPIWLHLLQFGMALNGGFDNEAANPGTLKTPLGVTWLTYLAGVTQNGWRARYSPELSYFFGPFGMGAQYYYENQILQAVAAGSSPVNVPATGFQVLATFLLTGERRTSFSQPVVPNDNFDPRHPLKSPGALELVVRTSRLWLDPLVFTPGVSQLVNPAFSSNAATELTVGLNWYLNAWVRVQINYERAWFDRPVSLPAAATGVPHSNTDTLAGRFQVIF
jgi:phosphate-selective porin OprO/OprP